MLRGTKTWIGAMESKGRLLEPGYSGPPFHLGWGISGAQCEKRRSEKAICKLLDVRLAVKSRSVESSEELPVSTVAHYSCDAQSQVARTHLRLTFAKNACTGPQN